MDYLSWHYKYANRFIAKVLGNYLAAGWHFFSIGILLKSLFAPWRRIAERKEIPGFSFQDLFQRLTFNLISRLIGFCVRFFLIVWGLVSLFFILSLGLILIITWEFIFPFSLPIFWLTSTKTKQEEVEKLLAKYPNPASLLLVLLSRPIGKFIVQRLGIEGKEILELCAKSNSGLSLPVNTENGATWKNLSDLFYWLVRDWPDLSQFLFAHRIKLEEFLAAGQWFENLQEEKNKRKRFWERENLVRGPGLGWNFCFGYTPTLDKYATDLTAPTPFFHQLVGREKEVARIEEILARRGENNILLVGVPGVGKHTIILGFARRVWQGKVRGELAHKRVLELDVNRIIQNSDLAAAKVKVTELLEQAQNAGNIILVIDNLHQFASAKGIIDLSDVLAHNAGGEKLQLIGIATPDDFSRYLAGNDQFLKIFEKVEVEPIGKEEALRILQQIVPDFEKDKNICFTYQALAAIINLSDKLISEIPFPEKAIDLVDQLISKYQNQEKKRFITAQDVEQSLAEKTKVPVGNLSGAEEEKLKNLESELAKRVIGQTKALSALTSALRRARLSVSSSAKPMGSFLFLGPTGVGKTETAKALAAIYFGSDSRILRFDMSQYQQQESLPGLIGTSGENPWPGLLTERIKDNPYAVLLLDELEKAHSKLLNVFLTIFDEGYLTDYRGRKVSFTDTMIIATSNAAAEFIREQNNLGIEQDKLQTEVMEYLQKQGIFSPEFLNRFDAVVVFAPLQESELEQVAQLQLQALNQRLKLKDLELVITPELVKSVATGGYSQEFGARPMKRWIADKVEDVIAKEILAGNLKRGAKINLSWDEAKKVYNRLV